MAKKEQIDIINVKVPGHLKQMFKEACEKNDTTMAQVVRGWVREYVNQNYDPQKEIF